MIYILIAAIILLGAFIVLIALNHFGFIESYHPMKKAKDGQIKVACVGDSITYGCTVKNRSKNNYPAVLGRMLGDKYCVNNFGYTNRTAIKDADYPYTKETLYQQSLDFKPDVVVIMLGSNDTKKNNWNKEKFTKDYCEILDSYLNSASKPEVYLLVPTPFFEIRGKVMWQLRKDIMIHEVYPAIKKIASDKSIHLIDMSKSFENRRELFSDGVHPNSKGSKKFAEIVFESIKQSVK